MRLRTALTALVLSAVGGVIVGLSLPLAPLVAYTLATLSP